MDKAVTYIKGAVDKQKAYDSVITKYGEELTDKQKVDLKVCAMNNTQKFLLAFALASMTLSLTLFVHGESDGRTLRWNLVSNSTIFTPLFQ